MGLLHFEMHNRMVIFTAWRKKKKITQILSIQMARWVTVIVQLQDYLVPTPGGTQLTPHPQSTSPSDLCVYMQCTVPYQGPLCSPARRLRLTQRCPGYSLKWGVMGTPIGVDDSCTSSLAQLFFIPTSTYMHMRKAANAQLLLRFPRLIDSFP